MTSLHDPAIELLRGALDPSHAEAVNRADSPACQVVSRAAQADVAAGSADNILQLAAGVTTAAALVTAWLAQEQDKDPIGLLTELDRDGVPIPAALELLQMMLSQSGMEQSAQIMGKLFQQDQEAFFDLIIDMGDFTSACIEMLERLGISSREEALDGLQDALKA